MEAQIQVVNIKTFKKSDFVLASLNFPKRIVPSSGLILKDKGGNSICRISGIVARIKKADGVNYELRDELNVYDCRVGKIAEYEIEVRDDLPYPFSRIFFNWST